MYLMGDEKGAPDFAESILAMEPSYFSGYYDSFVKFIDSGHGKGN